MLTHRRREPTTGSNLFSFSNPNSVDGVEYGTWAERIKGKYNIFGKSDDVKFGAWSRRTSRKENGKDDGEEEFRWLGKVEDDDDSEVQSPTLWDKSGSPATHSARESPTRDNRDYYHDKESQSQIHLSSRAQTIARYRQEMLDMVKDMPETAYELSLRDIVESPRMVKPVQENQGKGKEDFRNKLEGVKEEEKKKVVKKRTRKMSRSESMDTGVFQLKMFVPRIPTMFGSRKKGSGNSGTCAKVSPKPMIEKSTDGEWWNKEEFGDMSSSNSSSNSSSSTRSRRKLSGCYSFFRRRESSGI